MQYSRIFTGIVAVIIMMAAGVSAQERNDSTYVQVSDTLTRAWIIYDSTVVGGYFIRVEYARGYSGDYLNEAELGDSLLPWMRPLVAIANGRQDVLFEVSGNADARRWNGDNVVVTDLDRSYGYSVAHGCLQGGGSGNREAIGRNLVIGAGLKDSVSSLKSYATHLKGQGWNYRCTIIKLVKVDDPQAKRIAQLERRLTQLNNQLANLSAPNTESKDTTIYVVTEKTHGLNIRLNGATTITQFGYGLGLNAQFGNTSVYTDWTAAASLNGNHLLLAGRIAFPITPSVTLLLGGLSNVALEDGTFDFEQYLYAFETGIDWHIGSLTAGIYWTPGMYKDFTSSYQSEMDLKAIRVQLTYNLLDRSF